VGAATGGQTAVSHRLHADELAIDWGNLPQDSIVTLYVPQWDVDEVLRYDAHRIGPENLLRGHDHTIQIRVTGVGYVPIPGPSAKNIAALLSVQLPPPTSRRAIDTPSL